MVAETLTWSELADVLRKRLDLKSLLVFGSALQYDKPPRNRDIDFLGISRSSRAEHLFTPLSGYVIDMFTAPEQHLRQLAESRNQQNNNFVLYAFSHGRVLYDEGAMKTLSLQATDAWDRGPDKPAVEEAMRLHYLASKLCYALSTAASTPSDGDVNVMDLGTRLNMLTEVYCRASGLWFTKPSHLIASIDPRLLPLQHFLTLYLKRCDLRHELCVSMLQSITKALHM